MTKRDGTEILRGTASVRRQWDGNALQQRLGELKPLADPVILADLKVGMKTGGQTVEMDFDQNMGDPLSVFAGREAEGHHRTFGVLFRGIQSLGQGHYSHGDC